MRKEQLRNDITRILILSHYEIESKGNWGDTAEKIANFERRAIDRYQGKVTIENPMPTNIFHARVERDVVLIMRAIDESAGGPIKQLRQTPGQPHVSH